MKNFRPVDFLPIQPIEKTKGNVSICDKENIRCQFAVYDALYAWCSLDVAKTAKRKG